MQQLHPGHLPSHARPCAQGCCEHLVTIRDVCLVHPDHLSARLRCPLRAYTSYTRRRECNICTTRLAAKVRWQVGCPRKGCQKRLLLSVNNAMANDRPLLPLLERIRSREE